HPLAVEHEHRQEPVAIPQMAQRLPARLELPRPVAIQRPAQPVRERALHLLDQVVVFVVLRLPNPPRVAHLRGGLLCRRRTHGCTSRSRAGFPPFLTSNTDVCTIQTFVLLSRYNHDCGAEKSSREPDRG